MIMVEHRIHSEKTGQEQREKEWFLEHLHLGSVTQATSWGLNQTAKRTWKFHICLEDMDFQKFNSLASFFSILKN